MKKYLGILSIVVAILAVVWKLTSAGFSASPSPTVTTTAPDGTTQTSRINRQMVVIGPMAATEGANLLVTKDGVELMSSGAVSVKSNLAMSIDGIFSWVMIIMTLVAGIIFMAQSKKDVK